MASNTDILPAPDLEKNLSDSDKWEQEYQAFLNLRPTLPPKYEGRFVAVREGKVVDDDDDKMSLGLRVYQRFGYVPIYVGWVSQEDRSPIRIPSPRLIKISSSE